MAHFLITLGRGPEWDAQRGRRSQDGWDEHAAFMDELVRRGVVLLGGPLGDDVDAGPALVVVSASDAAAAAEALADDPWHDSVLVTQRVDRWTLWLGRGMEGYSSLRNDPVVADPLVAKSSTDR